jgi:hypothetical protein
VQHSPTPPVTEHLHQQQPPLLTLASPAEAELAPAAPGALEEWGSGLWVRCSSTGGAAAGSRLNLLRHWCSKQAAQQTGSC